MQLSVSTFIIEIVNFIVLVWLLNRLLYKPVRNAIEDRRKAVESTLLEAKSARAQARGLQIEYEDRLRSWERDKTTKQHEFELSLAEQKTHALAALEDALANERERQRVLDEQRKAALIQKQEEEALRISLSFCSRLLARVAGPESEKKIINLFVEDARNLPQDKIQELRSGFKDRDAEHAEVKTAYPLSQSQRDALSGALRNLAGKEVPCRFGEDPALMAGISVTLGPLVLRANLRDELEAFAQVSHLER
ncbi:MAG: F0F1 ATP synthase subunit delta [Acidobacteriota bacterium]